MPYATYRFNKIIAAETIRFIVTVAIVVYKGLKLVVYRMLTLRTNSTVETIIFEGEEAPELTGNPFPFKENILKIMVPSGKSEAYKAKWGSYEGYHSKIEERS